MKKIYIILLSVFTFLLFSQDYERVLQNNLFHNQGNNPFLVDRADHWYPIGLADFSEPRRLASFSVDDHIYRIRFRITLKNAENTAQSALQLRLNQNGISSQYHVPFDENHYLEEVFYSNWYIAEEDFADSSWRGPVNLRLLSPPGSQSRLEILDITMELWAANTRSDTEGILMASQGSFFDLSENYEHESTPRRFLGHLSVEEAESFAFEFIEYQINGDLPGFYGSLKDNIYSLDTGNLFSCYRIPPPYPWGNYSIADFKRDYSYSIYSYDQFIALFPQWAEAQRNWNPNENNYLFIAHQNSSVAMLSENAILTFMIGPGARGPQVIARPQF